MECLNCDTIVDCLSLKVVRRLRERGEPIRLFGESDQEAAKRLKWVKTA